MAGPTFSFWYASFTEEMTRKLDATLSSISSPIHRREPTRSSHRDGGRLFDAELYVETKHLAGRRYDAAKTGTIGVIVEQRRADFYRRHVAAAFVQELGELPRVELSAYCMAKGDGDWDALRLIAERVARAFGGWVILDAIGTELPPLPSGVSLLNPGVHEVVVRGERGVPEERHWVIDARLGPADWVRK